MQYQSMLWWLSWKLVVDWRVAQVIKLTVCDDSRKQEVTDPPEGACCREKYCLLLPSATKRQGNVFTPVCDSVHGGGGLCYGDPGQRPPWTETPLWTETLQIDTTRTETPPDRPPGQRPARQRHPRQRSPDRDPQRPPDRDSQTDP